MSDSDDWVPDASDSQGSDFTASNQDDATIRTVPMAGTLLYVNSRTINFKIRAHVVSSCRSGRYLPDSNLIFDTATQLVYANIGMR